MIALYHYFGNNTTPIEDTFKLIKAVGFDAVGVWRDDWFGYTMHRDYVQKARDIGLLVFDGHAPLARDYEFVNSLWLDNINGETTLEIYRQTIINCSEDGVKNLIIHIVSDYKGVDVPLITDLGIDRIKRLVELGEKCGVVIALENTIKCAHLAYVFNKIDSANLGFCYDTGHKNCKEPEVDFLSLFGNRLVALHLHDNNGNDDAHFIPFDGNIDWQVEMSNIAKTGYSGSTTLESAISRKNPVNSEEWLQRAFLAAKRLDSMRLTPQ